MDEPALVEYERGSQFPGVVGRTVEESTQAWPATPHAPEGAPNVVICVIDDVGFGQLSTFGGLVETPTFDAIAERGLRYTNFQSTALCSPTRACLMTGRNHHSVGIASITDMCLGFPGSHAMVGPENGFMPEILRDEGYSTLAVGKWHLAPPTEQTAVGPFDRWPLGKGFDRYYGFLGGETSQWHPDLVADNSFVQPPAGPEDGYHLNDDMAERAIGFMSDVRMNAPNRPFFLYYATGAGHSPHHVEREWVEKYAGIFDGGWDAYRETVHARQLERGIIPAGTELSERDPDVPAWESCSADERRLYARQMETFAGYMSQTDHHFGRVVDFIERIGELDNTILMLISDNGASAEGRVGGTRNEGFYVNNLEDDLEENLAIIDRWGDPSMHNHYAWGWAWAGDTPFRRWKRETYRGGINTACVLSWPAGIAARAEIRNQYVHAIDVLPTLLDFLGVEPPRRIRGIEQTPLQGSSFRYTIDDPESESRHATQYFEMDGHRAIYSDGWKAICPWPGPSLTEAEEAGRPFLWTSLTSELLDTLDTTAWELYNVAEDPAECHDVAADNPERLERLVRLWWSEAGRYNVLPLAVWDVPRLMTPRPTQSPERDRYIYYPGGAPIPVANTPRLFNVAHTIEAVVTVPDDGPESGGNCEGVLLAHGAAEGGYVLFVSDGHLAFTYNYLGENYQRIVAPDVLASGEHRLGYEFVPSGEGSLLTGLGAPGIGRLSVDGEVVATGELTHTMPLMMLIGGLSCGYDGPSVIDHDYLPPFRFNGEIDNVVIDVSGGHLTQEAAGATADAELDAARIRQ